MALTEQVFGNAGSSWGFNKVAARGIPSVLEKAGNASAGRPVNPKEVRSFLVWTMVDYGVPMAMASKMVGHQDIRTTQGRYCTLRAARWRVRGKGIPA